MLEKRTFPRLVCPKDKTCAITGQKQTRISGQLKDISRSGVSFISKNRLEDNAKADLLIKYPEMERDIPSVVRIIWTRPLRNSYIYGTRFVDISNEDKYDLLDHFYENWKKDFLSNRS